MAASQAAVSTVTPHSFVLRINLDATGDGQTIPFADVQGYASVNGPLRKFLLGYTAANCSGLNHALNSAGSSGAKKFRIYRLAGPIADSNGTADAAPRLSFVDNVGLVCHGIASGIATLYSSWGALFEFRYINSNVR